MPKRKTMTNKHFYELTAREEKKKKLFAELMELIDNKKNYNREDLERNVHTLIFNNCKID